MTRQRLLVQVRPVADPVTDQYTCPRCGLIKGLPAGRIKPEQCGDCSYSQSTGKEAIAFGMLSDGYTPKEVAEALDMDRRRVGQIRRRAMQ